MVVAILSETHLCSMQCIPLLTTQAITVSIRHVPVGRDVDSSRRPPPRSLPSSVTLAACHLPLNGKAFGVVYLT